jgi:hypothetical protein
VKAIEVDADVYRYLESKVRGFGDTPNFVLRRELGLDTSLAPASSAPVLAPVHTEPRPPVANIRARGKAPKTRLSELIRVGTLTSGQTLYFRDYQGNKIDGVEATIRGDDLVYKGVARSMSDLTAELMKGLGYSNDSYRGPDFWFTKNGQRIRDLWDAHLKKHR